MDDKRRITALDILVIALTVVFVTLKLCGVIAWSWAWVLSPLWLSEIPFVIVFVVTFVKVRRRKR